MANTSPFPYDTPVTPETTDRATGRKVRSPFLSQEIVDWLLEQQRRTDASAERLGSPVSLESQGAAISATPIPLPDLSAGYYRISYYIRITRAATVSSSLTPTFQWTDGGVSPFQSGAAIIGNTTTTQQNDTLFIHVDANAAITYSTAYVSVGATSMQYRLDIVIERLPS